MPVNSITGNTPAPMPNSGQPQSNHLSTIQLDTIRQLDGLYCLNDLHRMSGGKDKDKPNRFLRLDSTQGLITALEQRQAQKLPVGKEMGYQQMPVIKTIQGGAMQGTYASRKLVYAYAMWIDPYFYDTVLEVFDRVAEQANTYTHRVNALVHDLKELNICLSFFGRNLCIHGKQTKPEMLQQLTELLDNQQLKLQGI